MQFSKEVVHLEVSEYVLREHVALIRICDNINKHEPRTAINKIMNKFDSTELNSVNRDVVSRYSACLLEEGRHF